MVLVIECSPDFAAVLCVCHISLLKYEQSWIIKHLFLAQGIDTCGCEFVIVMIIIIITDTTTVHSKCSVSLVLLILTRTWQHRFYWYPCFPNTPSESKVQRCSATCWRPPPPPQLVNARARVRTSGRLAEPKVFLATLCCFWVRVPTVGVVCRPPQPRLTIWLVLKALLGTFSPSDSEFLTQSFKAQPCSGPWADAGLSSPWDEALGSFLQTLVVLLSSHTAGLRESSLPLTARPWNWLLSEPQICCPCPTSGTSS